MSLTHHEQVDIGHEILRPTPRRVDGAGSSLTRLSLTPSSASSSIHIENDYQEIRANQSPVSRSRDQASTNQSPAAVSEQPDSLGVSSRHSNTPLGASSANRLGSPFWTGLSSRDPQSRMFEFPERDVQPTSSNNSLNHITNLMIDKVGLTSMNMISKEYIVCRVLWSPPQQMDTTYIYQFLLNLLALGLR